MGSGQLHLLASRPTSHRLGRLSSSAGRQPLSMLLPPHGLPPPMQNRSSPAQWHRDMPLSQQGCRDCHSPWQGEVLAPLTGGSKQPSSLQAELQGAMPQHATCGKGRKRVIVSGVLCLAGRLSLGLGPYAGARHTQVCHGSCMLYVCATCIECSARLAEYQVCA